MLYLAVFAALLVLAALPVIIDALRPRREPLPDLTHEEFEAAYDSMTVDLLAPRTATVGENRRNIATIIDRTDLRVRYGRGASDTLMVSFTGVRHQMGGVPDDEFVGTAGENHCLFVSDMLRSWYNSSGLYETVVSTVRRVAEENAVQRIVCIGNSMGGFGALLFAAAIEAETAIAFSPQYSAQPGVVPTEERWMAYRDEVTDWRFPIVDDYRAATRYFLFFGSDAGEQDHARLYKQRDNMAIFRVDGAHNIAPDLKQRSLLRPVIRAAIDLPFRDARLSIERLLADAGALA